MRTTHPKKAVAPTTLTTFQLIESRKLSIATSISTLRKQAKLARL